MKKMILKIITIVTAFVLGILFMGHRMTAGNDDLMDSMAEATLPLVSFVLEGQELNTMHGYAGEMDGASVRGDVLPLPEDRKLNIVVDPGKTEISQIFYEVRSLDHERLIEDTQVGFTFHGQRLEAELPLKALLDKGEEYALVIRLVTGQGKTISYYSRIAHIGETRLFECLDFAMIWHEATFDKNNTVSITKYLESDATADNDTLEEVTIHSRYKQIIWDQMDVKPYSEPKIYVTEIESGIASLRLDYVAQHQNEEDQTEYYEVQEFFRIRQTDQRVYLLDYYRTTNRILDVEGGVFKPSQIELGILDDPVHYYKNEEENIVAFVQNGELWSYDHARNTLSYVMGFREGWDPQSNFGEHDMRIINMDESGSMHFLAYGYMNRGIHEGVTGIGVYRYDALANTVEELAFIKSEQPYVVLKELLGDLAYVTAEEVLYLYFDGNLYGINLVTRELSIEAQHLPKERYLLSEDQSRMAWQTGAELSEAQEIVLLNLDTGIQKTIKAPEGSYIRGLGFMGTDFIWGTAAETDVQVDFLGNIVFPMHTISIESEQGETIREFAYGEQGKYVISVSIEDNRISLECVKKASDGTYEAATPEPITNKADEKKEKIQLKTKNTKEKKREYMISFAEQRKEEEPTRLTPKQVLYEENRTLKLLQEDLMPRYYVYAQGRLSGSFGTIREAIMEADAQMGVVTDRDQQLIWNRSGRKTRTQISEIVARTLENGETSLEACIASLLSLESVYVDVKAELESGKSITDILGEYTEARVMNLSGCGLNPILYYVSEGIPVMALTGSSDAVLIVGYDAQNVILMDPEEGKIFKKGMKDSTAWFEESGNRFVVCLDSQK